MTDLTVALNEHLRKLGLELEGDFLRPAVEWLLQQLIELKAEQKLGAAKYEHAATRTTQRNGYRDRELETRVGERSLRIPKLRQGSYFPSLLEPRRRAEQALVAVIQEAAVVPQLTHDNSSTLNFTIERLCVSSTPCSREVHDALVRVILLGDRSDRRPQYHAIVTLCPRTPSRSQHFPKPTLPEAAPSVPG